MNIENRELYKTAFIVLLCFGLILSFLTPILIGSDEDEHFIRSEITSEGILSPIYINNANYSTIQSAVDLANHRGEAFVNIDIDTQPINQSQTYYPNAFAQNPFFGYLAPAFGIDIAKLISLDNFGMLVLGRFMNIVLFAGLTVLATLDL